MRQFSNTPSENSVSAASVAGLIMPPKPRARRHLRALIMALLAVFGIAVAGVCALSLREDEYAKTPVELMPHPGLNAHWTLFRAYDDDQLEHQLRSSYSTEKVSHEAEPEPLSLVPTDEFSFYWRDSGECLLLHEFIVRADRTASLVYYRTRQSTHDGKPVTVFDHFKADFEMSAAEVDALRQLIIAAKLGEAPAKILRKSVYDGAQWQFDLTNGKRTKTTHLSNAFPDQFRAIVVFIWRNLCAPRATFIDSAPRIEEPNYAGLR